MLLIQKDLLGTGNAFEKLSTALSLLYVEISTEVYTSFFMHMHTSVDISSFSQALAATLRISRLKRMVLNIEH